MRKSLLAASVAGLALGVESRRRKDSKLHEYADQFERQQVVSFMAVVVYPDGRVDVSFDAGADTQQELLQQYGKLAAGAIQGHDHLMNEVVRIGGN